MGTLNERQSQDMSIGYNLVRVITLIMVINCQSEVCLTDLRVAGSRILCSDRLMSNSVSQENPTAFPLVRFI